MTALFREAHGEYFLEWNNNVMMMRAVGTANKECFQSAVTRYAELIAASQIEYWAELTSLEGECLLIPETIDRMKEFIPQVASAGLRHIAFVINRSIVKSTTRHLLPTIFAGAGIEVTINDTLEEAVNWLNACGYRVDLATANAFFEAPSRT